MKLSDLTLSPDALAGLQGIEQRLQTRRYRSRWSLLIAALSVVAQLVLLLRGTFKIETLDDLFSRKAILLWLAVAAALIWLTARYTGFLFKQSRDPFRYTFSIDEFTAVASTPGNRFSVAQDDQLKLLRNDLAERLNRRVGRLSLLDPKAGDASQAGKDVNFASHFNIGGEYAVREDRSTGDWVIQVWPQVRIGPAGNPYKLSSPVRLPLEVTRLDAPPPDCKGPSCTLEADDYDRLLERVYSSITTEIYEQIKCDLQNKMTLFPTDSLRALARYNEAEDFASSNTIDAYDRARQLYRDSLHDFRTSLWHSLKKRFSPAWLLKWEPVGLKGALQAEARTRVGYSRCIIYRRLTSEMAGRSRNSILDVRKQLTEARKLLRTCYDALVPNALRTSSGSESSRHLLTSLRFPEATPWRPYRTERYQEFAEDLCSAYAVSALGHQMLSDFRNAENFLKVAEALNPQTDSNRLLLLLVKAQLAPRIDLLMEHLNKAKDINPESEIILYRLALYSDLLARDRDEITPEKVDALCRQYEAVLKVNPGNIASLINQGYLFWLVDDLVKARKKVNAGIELQKIVGETFIGDLKYSLARIEAEQGALQLLKIGANNIDPTTMKNCRVEASKLLTQAGTDYEESTLADSSVAAVSAGPFSRGANSYYDRINDQILNRYKQFACRVSDAKKLVDGGQSAALEAENHLAKALTKALSYAFNDCGNACLSYYLRFELGTETRHRDQALDFLDQARSTNSRARYNFFVAQTWTGGETIASELVKDPSLFPNELATVLSFASIKSRASDKPPEQARPAETPESPPDVEPVDAPVDAPNDKTTGDVQADAQKGSVAVPSAPKVKSEDAALEDANAKEKAAKTKEDQDKLKQLSGQPVSTKIYQELQPQAVKPRAAPPLGPSEIIKIAPQVLAKTRLAPLADDLVPGKIEQLLLPPKRVAKPDQPRIDWSRFGDSEVQALVALATVWSSYPQVWNSQRKALEACHLLCTHILREYYPQDFDTLQTRIAVSQKKKENRRDFKAVDRALKGWEAFDPKSRLIAHYQLWSCSTKVSRFYEVWPDDFSKGSDYKKAIEVYRSASKSCEQFPAFHYGFGWAHQNRERQLLESGRGEAALKQRRRALEEFEKACRLDPGNADYRNQLVATQTRHWAAGNKVEDTLNKFRFPSLVEIEFATGSVRDLDFTPTGLPPAALKKISALRAHLKREIGFVLPGINFRDNTSFEKGQYRALVCGVPLSMCSFDRETAGTEEKWSVLAQHIAKVARKAAWSFSNSQSVRFSLGDLAKKGTPHCSEIQNDREALSALTSVIRSLLKEGVPTVDMAGIVDEFVRCRSRKLSLVSTVEAIRALPELSRRLPGNSPEVAAIAQLSDDLQARISESIDWTCPEPVWKESPEIRQRVRTVALNLSREAGGKDVALLSGQEVRPFVSKLVWDLNVHVLSSREILPGPASRIRG
jgi:tetratricopeptide (TPR) repeat protein